MMLAQARLAQTRPSRIREAAQRRFTVLRPFREASFDPKSRTAEVVIITEGLGNLRDLNYYTPDAVRSCVEVFNGKQFYLDHPAKDEEENLPERSVEDLAGWFYNLREGTVKDKDTGETLTACFAKLRFDEAHAGVEAMNKVKAAIEYQQQFPTSKDVYCGISINGGGTSHSAEIDGLDVNMVTEITDAFSADIVTKPARGGRFLQLFTEAEKLSAWKRGRGSARGGRMAGKLSEAKVRSKGKEASKPGKKLKPGVDAREAITLDDLSPAERSQLVKQRREHLHRVGREAAAEEQAAEADAQVKKGKSKIQVTQESIKRKIKALEAVLGTPKDALTSEDEDEDEEERETLASEDEDEDEEERETLASEDEDEDEDEDEEEAETTEHSADGDAPAPPGDDDIASMSPKALLADIMKDLQALGKSLGGDDGGDAGDAPSEDEDEGAMPGAPAGGAKNNMTYRCTACNAENEVLPPKGTRLVASEGEGEDEEESMVTTESSRGSLAKSVRRLQRVLEGKETRFSRANHEHHARERALLEQNIALKAEVTARRRGTKAAQMLREAKVPSKVLSVGDLLSLPPSQWGFQIKTAKNAMKGSSMFESMGGEHGRHREDAAGSGETDATKIFNSKYSGESA